jgi:hypothetical protein
MILLVLLLFDTAHLAIPWTTHVAFLVVERYKLIYLFHVGTTYFFDEAHLFWGDACFS